MHNSTGPEPPNLSEGCYVCGGGVNEVLASRLVGGSSVALCAKHQNATTVPSKPFQFIKPS